MARARWRGIVASAAFLLTGCGPAVRSTPFVSLAPRPPTHHIRIYSTKRPECPYEEVGLVSARRRISWLVSMTDVLEALKARARQMGGDAVLGLSERLAVHGSGSDGVSSAPVLSGTVIRFTRSDCTQ